MKSTGEAIGYDNTMTRALYKALQASGMHLQNYGTVFATIADRDKEEALELIRRFYNLGFNIEATTGTAKFLKANGIRTHVLTKISDGSDEIPNAPKPTCDSPSPIIEKRLNTKLIPIKDADRDTKIPTKNALDRNAYEKISLMMLMVSRLL